MLIKHAKGIAAALVLTLLFTAQVECLEVRGEVREVDGTDVKIELMTQGSPELGDKIVIHASMPDGKRIPIGSWEVTGEEGGLILASVISNSGTPRVGQIAIFESAGESTGTPPEDAPRVLLETREVEGKVAEVTGLDVKIKLDHASVLPANDDSVQIYFTVSGGDKVLIGTWRVTDVNGDVVSASVVDHSGRPAVGHSALVECGRKVTGQSGDVVTSEVAPASTGAGESASIEAGASRSPVQAELPNANGSSSSQYAGSAQFGRTTPSHQRISVPREELSRSVSESTTGKPRVQIASQRRPKGLTSELVLYIGRLQSPDSSTMRRAAKEVYDSKYAKHPVLLKTVNSELLKGYKKKSNDKHHVDGMAWLCRILGASGNAKYSNTLRAVSKVSPSKKIRKHASKSLRMIEKANR